MTEYTVEKNIHKSLPYKYKCRVHGKYDEEFYGTSPNGIDKEYTDLTDYDGFGYTVSEIADVNATRIGNPTISDDGVLSGLSTTSYLKLETPFNPSSSIWEAKFKIKTGNDVSTTQALFHSAKNIGDSNRYGIMFRVVSSHFYLSISTNGNTWAISQSGTYTVLANTTYYIKFGWNGTEYYVKYSLDDNTYSTDVSISLSTSTYSSLLYSYVGAYSGPSVGSSPWLGEIDLNGCSIKTGSQYFPDVWTTVWEGVSAQHTLLNFSNTKLPWKWDYKKELNTKEYALAAENTMVTCYGNTLNGTANGVTITNRKADNFGSSNKITTNCSLSITPDELVEGLEIQIHLITGEISNQWIISNNSSWNTGLGFTINHGAGDRFWFILGNSDGSKYWQQITTTVPTANTEYWVRLIKGQGAVNALVQISSDGVNWTTENELDMGTLLSTFTTSGTITLGNLSTGSEYFKGKIFLQDTFVKIGGVEKWRGFDKHTLSGCLSGSTDSSGKYYCYAINGDDHVQLVKKTGSVIDTSAVNPRYLGEVSVV